MCTMCSRHLARAARNSARWIASSSAAGGRASAHARRSVRPWACSRSVLCCVIQWLSACTPRNRPNSRIRHSPSYRIPSSTCVNSGVPVGHMKALNPITPADASAGRCERLSVIKPPQSAKSTTDDASAAVTFAWNAAAVVVGGSALRGISTTVVTPPAAAARLHGHPVQLTAGRVTQRRQDRGGGDDGGWFTGTFGAERHAGFGFLDEHGDDGWHVEDGRDEVVGKRRVADPAIFELDLLHQCQTKPLRGAALDLARDALRVDGTSNILRRRNLHDAHEAEVFVDFHDGTLRGKHQRDVWIALPGPIERGGFAMTVDAGLLDRFVKEFVNRPHAARAGKNLPLADGQRRGRLQPLCNAGAVYARKQGIAHRPARQLHGPTGHHRLPRGGTGSG